MFFLHPDAVGHHTEVHHTTMHFPETLFLQCSFLLLSLLLPLVFHRWQGIEKTIPASHKGNVPEGMVTLWMLPERLSKISA